MRGALAALTVESANEILANLFGKESAEFVNAIYVKDGVLGVRVNSSSAASEVKLNESLILSEISSKYGEKAVNKIRIIL